MILYNLKFAIRNLLKNKLYSALILGSFSIGFTASILIGLYYYAEKNVNKDFTNYRRIYRVYDAGKNDCLINYDMFPILTENYSEIEDACPLEYLTGMDFTIKNEQTNVNIHVKNIISTTNKFFQIFTVDFIQSLSDKPFDGIESVVLTESMAHMLFGAQNPLGQKISINNYYAGNVTAIIKDLPANSTFNADILMNSENENFRMSKYYEGNKCISSTSHFLLVKPETDLNRLTNRLNNTMGSYGMDSDSLALQNIADIYLSNSILKGDMQLKGNGRMLNIFLVIAVLIILLSSINYFNYIISKQFAKLKEIGINKTNGAGWCNLATYSLTEVTLGIFLSVLISLIMAMLLMPYTEILFGKPLHLNSLKIKEIIPALVMMLTIILVNSLAPIYMLSRFNVNEFLSGFGKRKGKQIGKQILLTFQLTVSIALIAVVIVIFKQLNFVKHSNLGFDKELLVRIDLPYKFKNSGAFKQEIGKLSFVKSSTLSAGCPGMIQNIMTSGGEKNKFHVSCISVGEDYLKTMGIALLEGREFHDGDNNKVCLMNEEAVTKFEWDNIEGKKFEFGREGEYAVVGITKNFHVRSMHAQMDPVALIYNPKQSFNILSLRLSSGNIGEYINKIKVVWKNFEPHEPMTFSFYDDQFQAMYSKEEKLAKSITFFSFIAIILTCMGILGQIFMICITRTKEIGIRKINGARVSEILTMLNKDFVKWVVTAFVIACPIAYYAMSKWLENFAYKTELSWWVFALAGLMALAIALITISWQSWKAATRNPVEALRYE